MARSALRALFCAGLGLALLGCAHADKLTRAPTGTRLDTVAPPLPQISPPHRPPVTPRAVTPPAPPQTITLAWDNVETNVTTEIWSSTNLTDWTLATNVQGNRATLPQDKPQEFFKARNKLNIGGTNWLFSDWARKTNR